MTDPARFWDAAADKYARAPIRDLAAYERTLERVRHYLTPRDEVLEVGCGTGTTALRLAPSAKRISALDIAPRMIEIAREKAAAQGVENVRFERGTLDDAKLEPGSFDVVMGFNFLHLLEDLPGAVARVHALLKPGGTFVSKSVCLKEHSRLWAIPLAVLRAMGRAPYVSLLRIAELEGIITDAGFEILETGSYPESRRWPPSPPNRFVVARRSAQKTV